MERRYNFFWPLVFIATGIMWMLVEMGTVPVSNIWALTYLWPLLLIGAGVGLLLRPYWSYASALMSVLVIGVLFAGIVFADRLGWNHVPQFGVANGWFIGVSSQRGSGHIVTETREARDFNAVHVNYPATVVIKQGSSESLTIEADDNVVASIKTQVVNHVLEIGGLNQQTITVLPTRPVQITILTTDLSGLDFNAAGEVDINGLKTEKLDVNLEGAGNLRLLNLQVNTLAATLSGVGSMNASGTAKTLTARVDGVGNFDASQLKAQNVTATLNGLGNANVWADSSLNATINGVGSVNYSGSAQVTKSLNGLGTVKYTGAK